MDFIVDRLEALRGSRKPEDFRILVWDCGTGQTALPLAALGYQVTGIADDGLALAKAKATAVDLGLRNVEFSDRLPEAVEPFAAAVIDGSSGLRPLTLGHLGSIAGACEIEANLFVWQTRTDGYPRKKLQQILRAGGWKAREAAASGSVVRRVTRLSGRWLKRSGKTFHALDRLDGRIAASGRPCWADGFLLVCRRCDPAKKTAVQIVDSLHPGGAERLVLELAKRLPDVGYETRVLAVLGGGELEPEFLAAGIPVKALGYRWPFALDAVWKIYGYLKLEQPELVHTHLYAADVYGRLAARLAGVKCIIATEHNVNLDFGRLRRWAKRLANRWAGSLIAVSRTVEARMVAADRAEMEKVSVIPNGIDLARVIPRPARHFRDIPRLLALCRLSRQKDLGTLLKALALVKEGWILQIAGVGEAEAELKALVRRLGLEPRVEFLGYRADAPELLAQADVFCLPSRYEGQGLAVLEAAAAGVPLVLSDLAVFREFLGPDQAVFVPPGDVPAWAQALRSVLRDPETAVARAQAARHQVARQSGIDAMVKSYAETYGRACPTRRVERRRRVIHVLPTLYPGGAERLVFELVKRLPECGFDASAIAVYGGGELARDFQEAGLAHQVLGRRGPFNCAAFFRLWSEFRRSRPDIVHGHLLGSDMWARLAARAAGVPLVVSTEHNVNLDFGWEEILAKRLLSPLVDGYVAVSNMVRDHMVARERLPAGKIGLVRNGIDPARIQPRNDGPRHEPARLLNIGRLSEQKDQATLLRALSAVAVPWELRLAGTGELEDELKRQAADLGMADRVHFLGFRRDIGELLRGTDVYISTSRWEGLALTAIEAAAAGVPCVLPDIAASYEVAKRDEAEFAQPGDADGFTRAVERVLDGYPAAAARAAQAAVRVRRDLSIDRMVAGYADHYRTLLAGRE